MTTAGSLRPSLVSLTASLTFVGNIVENICWSKKQNKVAIPARAVKMLPLLLLQLQLQQLLRLILPMPLQWKLQLQVAVAFAFLAGLGNLLTVDCCPSFSHVNA